MPSQKLKNITVKISNVAYFFKISKKQKTWSPAEFEL